MPSLPPRQTVLRFALTALAVGLCGFSHERAAADTWIDTHDEPTPAWELETSAGAQLVARERVRTSGGLKAAEIGAERIAYASPPGIPAWAWRRVPEAAVIAELVVEADIRTKIPGTLLAVEVVLPRVTNAEGQPLALRLRSTPLAGVANELRLDQLPLRLQREARVWRVSHPDEPIDVRGAYVRRVGVGLPSVGRPAEALICELRLQGLVAPFDPVEEAPEATVTTVIESGTLRPTEVTLRSDGFRIDGELFYPRAWRWRGEPMAQLAAMGVNTLWLETTATPQQLVEAAHHRLRLVCPAPASSDEAAAVETWDRVLAWVLPGTLGARDLDTGLVRAEDARLLPPAARRPILASITEAADEWSRVADGLVVDIHHARVVPPGTPALRVVRLDIGPQLTAQLDALLGDGLATVWLPPADVAAGVDGALTEGAIGVAFTANERLDEADDATIAAAGWLEAVNRRLRLVEPWLTGPRSTHPVSDAAVLLNRGGVRLATTPLIAAAPVDGAKLLLPGVDETARVYRLSPAGLAPWPLERMAGGVGVRPPGGESPGDLLVCNDSRVVKSLQDYTRQTAARAAANLLQVAEKHVRLTEALPAADRQSALRRLSEARLAMSRRDHAAAYDAAHAALALVSAAERQRRDIAQQGTWATSSPLSVLPATLTDSFRMSQLLAASPRGPNRLHGGSFEDIEELRRVGWRHPSVDGSEAAVEVELATASPMHGERVLRLRGERRDASSRIVSPTIELQAGDTVEVTGWARVAATPLGGKLTITDTLGGDELALSIDDTAGEWRPFHLLRATSAATTLRVSLTIDGAVTADIDGVMVRTIEPLGVAARGGAQPK
ncbi:hypothetical protein Pla108_30690 [Botrimarina colliarenosi]|uniref:Uncharacterized protein n=1 Tax=Botrimarina colliarenosi TaxID=2528001 RepID=A0A5C6A9B5_9BACT|nr:hypothetical protein [Botrimarina colliarenosi]TWT95990.1 hypothetical protein Pla108_30690 [Botrimarina colliarenosi]